MFDYYYYYYYYYYHHLLYIGSSLVCPQTNHVPRGYAVAATLSFYCLIRCMAHIFLVPALVLMVFYVSTFRRMCAVPNMAVFCSSRTSWLPGMVPTYFPK